MSIEDVLYIGGSSVPDCCWNCKHYESDSKDVYSSNYYYCKLGIAMPTKKKSQGFLEKCVSVIVCARVMTEGGV